MTNIANTHAVRRRLTESLHRQFITTMVAREMPYGVALDALLLVDGNEQAVHDALDYLGIGHNVVVCSVDCIRLLTHLRRGGKQL